MQPCYIFLSFLLSFVSAFLYRLYPCLSSSDCQLSFIPSFFFSAYSNERAFVFRPKSAPIFLDSAEASVDVEQYSWSSCSSSLPVIWLYLAKMASQIFFSCVVVARHCNSSSWTNLFGAGSFRVRFLPYIYYFLTNYRYVCFNHFCLAPVFSSTDSSP